MDNRDEVRAFLASRRAKVTPEQAGLPVHGSNKRRVSGLRREEVALLAGVSVDYYTQLERGKLGGVSESVLEALARALQLDESERAHLLHLSRTAAATSRPRRRRSARTVRPPVQRILDAMADIPAFVRNGRLDLVAANPLARALYHPLCDDPERQVNMARFCFLDPAAPDLYRDWDDIADGTVATLRAEAGRDPLDRDLHDLIGELSTRSEPFRQRWASHDVSLHQNGIKQFHHAIVGDLDFTFESLEVAADPTLTMTVYSCEPASASQDALTLLASWAATPGRTPTPTGTEQP